MHRTQGPAGAWAMIGVRTTIAMIVSLSAALASFVVMAADPSDDTSPIPIVPTTVVPLADRTITTIPIEHADAIVGLGGAVWVRTDDGRVVHVDADGAIVAEVRVDTTSDPYHYCQALGSDGESIWACSAAGGEDDPTIAVVQVDATTHEVVRTVPVDMIFDQFELPAAAGRIWALVEGGSSLTGIDIATGEASTPTDLGARCTQLTVVGGSLVAACPADDVLLLIDPSGPVVSVRGDIEDVQQLAASGDELWVARTGSVSRIDPASLAITADRGPLPGVADLALDDGSVWIRHGVGFLYRLDLETGLVIEQLIPDGPTMSPGSVLASGDAVWVTANDEGVLIQVSRESD